MNRMRDFLSELKRRGMPAALVHRPENMRYLTGYTGEGCLFVSEKAQAIWTDFRYVEQASRQAPGLECVRTRMGKSVEALIGELLERAGASALAVETDFVCHDGFVALQEALPGVQLAPLGAVPEAMRARKDEGEIACIQRAADIACRAFDALLGKICPGMTEREVALALDYEMLKLGSECAAFPTIACAGANGALPHATPGDHALLSGELLTLDFGATCEGYRSDMTRTVGVGKVSQELKAVYQTVLDAQLLALEAVRPGAVCQEVDRVAREYIDARYPGAFGHSLGHGVGLNIHEQPRLGKGDETVLQAGHVVTIEPGIYIPGLGGCRIEDMAILTSDGYVNPIVAPKHLIEL